MRRMRVNWISSLLLIFMVLVGGFSLASATPPPAKIVNAVVSNVVSALFKWLWSLKSNSRTANSGGSLMKFEGGYRVETVFDGSKLGIEPYSVEVSSPNGEFLLLDSENSNLYKISTPFSPYSRPKLIAGSLEGRPGHVDGRPREARMNHPKGLTVDDRGNIYVADTLNMAIRKISEAGVVTIAGGMRGLGGRHHVDGPSEDAKFSDDFDLVYIGSSCSLLVIDRGHRAIREIQLRDDDCSLQDDDATLRLGIAVLVAAAFFGYMLALLQCRVAATFSSRTDYTSPVKRTIAPPPYQRPHKSVRPPSMRNDDELERLEEGLFGSLGRLFFNTGSSVIQIFEGLFTGFRKKSAHPHIQHQYYHHPIQHSSQWPMQETFVIPHEDDPPPARKTYPFMTKEPEKSQQFKQNPSFRGGWDDDFHHQQQYHQRHYSSGPQTCYEQACETNEIVFGAVQEQDGRREAMVIKAVDYGDPVHNNRNVRSRYNYMGYSYGY